MSSRPPRARDDDGREDSTTTLIRLLRQLNVETDQFAQLFGEAHGLHRTDLNALVVVMDAARRGESVSAGQLARALDLSASATTAVLDRLEGSGHVRRDRDAADRRRVHLLMPETTIQLGEQFFGPLRAELTKAWSRFDDDQRELVVQFLAATIDATVRARGRVVNPRREAGDADPTQRPN